jgi:hypothetical protein
MSKPLDRDMAGIDRDIPGNDRDIPGIDRDIPAIDRDMASTSENLSLARLRSHNVHISVQKWQAAMLTLMLRQVLSKNVLQHILIEFSLLNGIINGQNGILHMPLDARHACPCVGKCTLEIRPDGMQALFQCIHFKNRLQTLL